VKLAGQQGNFSHRCCLKWREFVKAAQTAPVALNVSGLGDSGVLAKLLIDDSVTERKLSPMHNSWGYLFALKVADRKVSDCLLTINFQITYKRNIKNRRVRPGTGVRDPFLPEIFKEQRSVFYLYVSDRWNALWMTPHSCWNLAL